MLLDVSVQAEARDERGHTPLQVARSRKHESCANLIKAWLDRRAERDAALKELNALKGFKEPAARAGGGCTSPCPQGSRAATIAR